MNSTHPDLLYHHCIPVSAVNQRIITPEHSPAYPDFLPAYKWVEEVTGFYPLFLAVGTPEIIWMTGYQDNWRIWTGGDSEDGIYRKTYRKKGEFPNLAVFSFENPDGIYMDYDSWHIALNTIPNGRPVPKSSHVKRPDPPSRTHSYCFIFSQGKPEISFRYHHRTDIMAILILPQQPDT